MKAHLGVGLVLPWKGLEGAALMSRRATLKNRDFTAAWLLLREGKINFKVIILKSILNLHFSKFV